MHRQRATQSQLSTEPLEPRRLLAATIVEGVLVAIGTGGADVISVRRVLTDDVIVTINGATTTFDMDDFTGVRIEGLGGNDTFRLIDPLVSPVVRNTTVLGGAGNDTLDYSSRSTSLDFRINLEAVLNTVSGGAQSDRFADVETLVGGSGNDSFSYSQGTLSGADTTTSFRLEGRGGNDTFHDHIFPHGDAFGAVTMLGGAGDDHFADSAEAHFNNEFFFGEAGNDSVTFYTTNDGTIDGGAGIDTVFFAGSVADESALERADLADFPGFDNATKHSGTLIGTDGPNRLVVDGGTILGLGGNDTLIGGNYDDDLISGGDGDDTIFGGGGNDTIDGGAGFDTIDGGLGDDTVLNGEVLPGPGTIGIVERILIADSTWGGQRITIERTGIDDVIVRIDGLSSKFDMDDFDGVLLRGNRGFDEILVLDPLTSPLARKVTLDGGAGDDFLVGNDEDDVLRGGDGRDTLDGGRGRNALFGDAGPDSLDGRSDQPAFVDGGAGDDLLITSNQLRDTVRGGTGTDAAIIDVLDDVNGVEEVEVR
jgi:Ca2+-binding RTX toxin-like protein